MPLSKRLFDLAAALVLSALLWPLALVVALAILILDGRPVFYLSERMRAPGRGFQLVKFRTMRPDTADWGASGPHKSARITRTGRFLRRSRLDELPQLWNVLCGDLSFVGPRPPLRRYVEMFPALYAEVLRARPGITGLATLVFHRHEEWWLARARDAAESEAIYCRICVPRKARLDRLYQRRRSLALDAAIMIRTVFRRFPLRRKPQSSKRAR